jgi:uncharacterized membrane protein YfcA
MTLWDAVLLTGGGVLAGVANTMAGGGSSVTLPLLLGLGLPAPLANGTNHVAHLIGALARLSVFAGLRAVDGRTGWALALPAVTGSLAGAWLATVVPPAQLREVIVCAVLAAAVLLVLNPKRLLHGDPAGKPRVGLLQVIVLALVGAWAGFVVVGFGTFLLLALTLCVGLGLTRALAVKALLTVLMMAVALPAFVHSGEIDGLAALCLGAGTAVGSGLTAWLAVSARAKRWLYGLVLVLVWAEALELVVRYLSGE